MVKSPMEYFQDQDFSVPASSGQDISPAERAFLKKYLGIDDVSALQGLPPVDGQSVASFALHAVHAAAGHAAGTADQGHGTTGEAEPPAAPVSEPAVESREASDPAPAPVSAAPSAPSFSTASTAPVEAASPAPSAGKTGEAPVSDEAILPAAPSLDEHLREEESVTLVGFYVSGDVFVVPIDAVLEVIRYEEPFKLPMAPSFLPGVVNLRGRILPVVSLQKLLILEGSRPGVASDGHSRLIVICEVRGLQMGLVIDRLHTIFKAGQDKLNWNADAHLGPGAELLCGLLETDEKLLGILSVERLVDKLLEV